MIRFRAIPVGEFCAQPFNTYDEIAELLRDAANRVVAGSLDGAAWRIADASLLLRKKLPEHNAVVGRDVPTGMSALLGGHHDDLC